MGIQWFLPGGGSCWRIAEGAGLRRYGLGAIECLELGTSWLDRFLLQRSIVLDYINVFITQESSKRQPDIPVSHILPNAKPIHKPKRLYIQRPSSTRSHSRINSTRH